MSTILENVSDTMPLKLYDPTTLIVFLSFYSPIIIVASVIILSVVNQNFKGFKVIKVIRVIMVIKIIRVILNTFIHLMTIVFLA
jgi:hypothetical protein